MYAPLYTAPTYIPGVPGTGFVKGKPPASHWEVFKATGGICEARKTRDSEDSPK